MRTSLLGTLANKHKTRIAPIYRRLRTEVKDRGRTQERGEGKRPLVATFGGISLAWKRDVILSDRPPAVYGSGRSEMGHGDDLRQILIQGRSDSVLLVAS